MAANFVETLNSLAAVSAPLRQFTSQNTFPEFYPSSVLIFAFEGAVSESGLHEAANTVNEQAQAELGFDDAELSELSYAAGVPEISQLHARSAPDTSQ
jgi:hypothetical protein